MNRTPRIPPALICFLSAMAIWLFAATQALAADAPNPPESGFTDYILSYLVVVLGIVLGMLVVAKASGRRDRERPAGYVEKNLLREE
jgi:heme/copper-type cytochrome/quinol oxidase subunit 2